MKRQDALLIAALVLLTIFATAFAMINYANPVKVWPLMSFQPLTLVIGVSFLLGASVGGLLVSLVHRKRAQSSMLRVSNAAPTDGAPGQSAA